MDSMPGIVVGACRQEDCELYDRDCELYYRDCELYDRDCELYDRDCNLKQVLQMLEDGWLQTTTASVPPSTCQ
jgi:hypothetical protein